MDTIKNDMANYWSRRAENFSRLRQREFASEKHEQWLAELDRYLPRGRKLDILDIGTGTGFFAFLLAERGHHVTGIDLTPDMIREAKKTAERIGISPDFCIMGGEAPDFPPRSFEAIVTRKLTWALPDLPRTFRNWHRLLKPGGIFINFDANWYRYLYDAQAETGHHSDRENVRAAGAADDTAGTDVAAVEAIARQAPLSRRRRPQWDQDVLGRLGMRVSADTEVWKQVWTRDEWINNASTPMFLIAASKPA